MKGTEESKQGECFTLEARLATLQRQLSFFSQKLAHATNLIEIDTLARDTSFTAHLIRDVAYLARSSR